MCTGPQDGSPSADTAIKLSFSIDSVLYEFASPDAYVSFFQANFGPLVLAKTFSFLTSRVHFDS